MNRKSEKRQYLEFDPTSGYPGGQGVYFECLRCGEVIPSLPSASVMCKCRNIRIDADYGRVAISDPARLRVFAVADAVH